MTPVTSVRSYMTYPGNHEASCRQFAEDFCSSEL